MKIFIIGCSNSGKTTISKILSREFGSIYIDPISWLKSTFREKNENEHPQQYKELYNDFVHSRLKLDPDIFTKNIKDLISLHGNENQFIIDGLISPKDFIQLFDYNQDIVIFLNRIDNEEDEHAQNIFLSVIRDYCFWLSACNLLNKDNWLEFNFSIPGDQNNNFIKKLGTHNTVLLCKSVYGVISYLRNILNKSSNAVSNRFCE